MRKRNEEVCMNICISANDRYIYPAKVMLTSFLVNNRQASHNIYFLYKEVQAQNLRELETLVRQYDSQFIPTKICAEDFAGMVVTDRFPVEIYFRLLIPQLMPETETRALWMDVDLIVNGAIDDFYYQDFEDKVFVAYQDASASRAVEQHAARMRVMGFPPYGPYINSGVVLFNLEQMRRYSIEDYMAYYNAHKEGIGYPDQDILNGVFVGKIKLGDDPRYNVQVWFDHPLVGEERTRFLKEVRVVHFVGGCKPWHNKFESPTGELWDIYHQMAFKESRFYLQKKRILRRLVVMLRRVYRKIKG